MQQVISHTDSTTIYGALPAIRGPAVATAGVGAVKAMQKEFESASVGSRLELLKQVHGAQHAKLRIGAAPPRAMFSLGPCVGCGVPEGPRRFTMPLSLHLNSQAKEPNLAEDAQVNTQPHPQSSWSLKFWRGVLFFRVVNVNPASLHVSPIAPKVTGKYGGLSGGSVIAITALDHVETRAASDDKPCLVIARPEATAGALAPVHLLDLACLSSTELATLTMWTCSEDGPGQTKRRKTQAPHCSV